MALLLVSYYLIMESLSTYQTLFQDKMKKIMDTKEKYLSKIESYQKQLDELESKNRDKSQKWLQSKKEEIQKKITQTMEQLNTFLETKQKQAQDWLQAKIEAFQANIQAKLGIEKEALQQFNNK